MIVVLKHGVTDDKRDQLISWLKNLGLQIHISVGAYQTVLGLIGDTSRVDMDLVGSLEIVDAVKRVTEPFKCCNSKFHPEDMVVDCQGVKIGGGNFVMIAGPCSVESEEQIVTVAKAVKAAGADGLIIEVHNDPIHALCDGAQSLRPEEYAALAEKVAKVREAIV